jgi:hypothetical protein
MKSAVMMSLVATLLALLAVNPAGADTCVNTTDSTARDELGAAPAGPQLLSTTYFFPAGAPVDVVLKEEYKSDNHYVYFGHIETDFDTNNKGQSNRALNPNAISAKQIPADHALVQRGTASKTDTLLTVDLPSAIGSFWKSGELYIFRCGPHNPLFASTLTMPVSTALYSNIAVWALIIVIYLLSAIASKVVDIKSVPAIAAHFKRQPIRVIRYLDPVYMTSGSDGKGSLSKLQILFFSLIVFGLLTYIVLRTGVLSDLSGTVLLLLGIAGVGSAAAKGTDVQRNRIDSDNWAWFILKHWLPPGGLAAANDAKWRDIVESDGEFDVYRFQSLIFSLVVGVALLAAGINQLASFTIPEALLGILGLSQVVYIGGKLVAPPATSELNDATTKLIGLESDFITSAAAAPDPTPPPNTSPSAPPASLDAAKRRAAPEKYTAYLKQAKLVRITFQSITGRTISDADLEPAFAA